MWILIILCVSCVSALEISFAPFISKCALKDENCQLESMKKAIPVFADGLPELNVEILDPMKIERVNATKPGLELIATDIVVTGLKNCESIDLKRDIPKEKIFLKLQCSVTATGQYDMNGQLLFIPIVGNGPLSAKLHKIEINVDLDYLTIEKEDQKYWKVKTWQYSYELKEKSDVKFENLFPDNKVLHDSTTALIANNGNEVIVEMGTPLIRAVVAKVVKNISNFFKIVPLADLLLD